MRLFDMDAVGVFLDTYSPRGEKTTEGETAVLDLTLRVQPFTPALATSFDTRVRAKIFSLSEATQDPMIAELKLRGIDPPKQDVTVFLLPENKRAAVAFFDVECSDFRVRAEKGVDGYALVFYATVGPLGAEELEEIYKWHRQQRFLTFNKSQSVLNFEAKSEDKAAAPAPPRPSKAKHAAGARA